MTHTVSTHISRREFLHLSGSAGLVALAAPLSLAGADPGYEIGCYTRPWDQFDYKVALDGIAEAGYKWAGLMTAKGKSWVMITVDSSPDEVSSIASEVKKRGLKTLSIYGGDFPAAKSVEAGIAGLRKLVDHCALCSCPNLLLGGTTDEKLTTAYYAVVKECCDYAQSKGVGLSIKPHGGQNATGPQCRKIIESVGHKNFRLWYDPGNIFYYSDGKLDPVDDSKTVGGLVVGMSVKDFKQPKEVLVTPGDGQVNFSSVVQSLKAGGFKGGPVVVECLAKLSDAAAITIEAQKTRKFLQELFG